MNQATNPTPSPSVRTGWLLFFIGLAIGGSTLVVARVGNVADESALMTSLLVLGYCGFCVSLAGWIKLTIFYLERRHSKEHAQKAEARESKTGNEI